MVSEGYSTCCIELDELLGPLKPGTILLLEGLPGSGKTIFSLALAYRNIVEGKARCIYLTLSETTEKLVDIARAIGLEIAPLIEEGKMKIVRIPMLRDIELVNFVTSIIATGYNEGFDVFIIDSVTPLMKVLESYAAKRAWIQSTLYDFTARTRGLLILIADILRSEDPDVKLLEYVADIVIELRYSVDMLGIAERILTIKKYRGRALDILAYPFEIGRGGITLLNYVSRKVREELWRKRKPISMKCEPLAKIIGNELKPGTQILVLDRDFHVANPNLVRPLLAKTFEFVEEGRRVGLLGYEPSVLEVLKSYAIKLGFGNLMKGIKVVHLDPLLSSPNIIVREELRLARDLGIEVMAIASIEKVVDVFGYDTVKKYAIYGIKNLKSMGVTTLRYYRLRRGDPEPRVYMDWSDIVIEIDTDEMGRALVRIHRPTYRGTVAELSEEDIAKCISL